jgi:ATP-dependent protease ClpP protease subunit
VAEHTTRYRFRGSVEPSAEIKRPVAVHRHAATETGTSDAAGKSTSATIDIFDVIDSYGGWWGVSAAEVDAALKQIGNVDTLYVRVNSPGGEATEGVAIANVLRAYAATVHITNYGLAASAASLIAVSGDTLSMAPGSLLMIHEAWNVIAGSADDMRAEAGVLDKISDSYAAVYALKGGTATDWRTLMHDETWFTPEDAVAIGLADKVGIDPAAGVVDDPAEDDLPIEVNVDIEITPATRAAARFDLSMFSNLPAAVRAAHKPPAEPPEKHPTTEEAVTMTETELKALRERLGLAEDADEATVTAAAVAAALADPPDDQDVTDEQAIAALAKTTGLDADKVKAALAKAGKDDEPTVPEGKVLISQTMFDELKAGAADGSAARKKQLEQERDEAIAEAFSQGKISADRRDAWKTAWDKDPDGTKADLTSLEVRFPVGQPAGYAGSDGTDGEGTQYDKAAAEAEARWGISKEALTNV